MREELLRPVDLLPRLLRRLLLTAPRAVRFVGDENAGPSFTVEAVLATDRQDGRWAISAGTALAR